jgi:hypothetical protein
VQTSQPEHWADTKTIQTTFSWRHCAQQAVFTRGRKTAQTETQKTTISPAVLRGRDTLGLGLGHAAQATSGFGPDPLGHYFSAKKKLLAVGLVPCS